MPRNKTRAIEDIDISIALANFGISPLINQCKLNDIGFSSPPSFLRIITMNFLYASEDESHSPFLYGLLMSEKIAPLLFEITCTSNLPDFSSSLKSGL